MDRLARDRVSLGATDLDVCWSGFETDRQQQELREQSSWDFRDFCDLRALFMRRQPNEREQRAQSAAEVVERPMPPVPGAEPLHAARDLLERAQTVREKHRTFLARWPSRQAMQRARGRVRELTDRRRLREPVEDVVQDVNRFLRGWAGYFRHGNSADAFDTITLPAQARMAGFIAKRHKQRTRYGWWLLRHHPDQIIGLISLSGIVVAPRPYRSRHRGR